MKIFTALLSLFAFVALQGCAYNSTMGDRDQFAVSSTSSFAAPSVTCVEGEGMATTCYAGPSLLGQSMQAAGTVAGGYLLGKGNGQSGTKVTQNGATATQNQGQGQGQGQAQAQGQQQGQDQSVKTGEEHHHHGGW